MRTCFLLFFLFSSLVCFGQAKDVYTIDEVDTFPTISAYSCNGIDGKECFEQQLKNIFESLMVYPQEEFNNNIKGAVYAQFVVTKKGKIEDIKTRSTHKAFEKEIIRILKSVKNLEPATKNERAVSLLFNIPFQFNPIELNQKIEYDINNTKSEKELFSELDMVPIFPGCEDSMTKDKAEACFKEKIQNHIRINFNYPELAIAKKISGKVSLLFAIKSNGEFELIKVKSPNRLLTNESIRIVSLLPKVKPAIKDGKPVTIPFGIPITFLTK